MRWEEKLKFNALNLSQQIIREKEKLPVPEYPLKDMVMIGMKPSSI